MIFRPNKGRLSQGLHPFVVIEKYPIILSTAKQIRGGEILRP